MISIFQVYVKTFNKFVWILKGNTWLWFLLYVRIIWGNRNIFNPSSWKKLMEYNLGYTRWSVQHKVLLIKVLLFTISLWSQFCIQMDKNVWVNYTILFWIIVYYNNFMVFNYILEENDKLETDEWYRCDPE